MRILYGVVGEGMGHAIRSRVILEELVKEHEVQVVVSGRAHDYLHDAFRERLGVRRIWGLTIVYEDNAVRRFRTVLRNARGAVTGWPENVRAYFRLAREFEPDVVVSDFESWSYLFALRHGLPTVSVDNLQMVARCAHPDEIIAGHWTDFRIARELVRHKLPRCFHYHITTFFRPPVSRERTTLHPPVLRPRILEARPEEGEHLLVYQTSTENPALPAILRETGLECRIYGLRRDLSGDLVEGRLVHRPFSEERFVEDLRTARAVIAGGGFTLMGEAVYLGKPMLSVPVRGHFEQILNARYLEHAGYGRHAVRIDRDVVLEFLEAAPECRAALASYRQDGNRDLLEALAATLARVREAEGGRGGGRGPT